MALKFVFAFIDRVSVIIPLKKGIMFFTLPLGLSVCVCVCLSVCVCVCLSVITFAARWPDLATQCQVRSILSTRTSKYNTSHDDPFQFPFHMDHPYKITFWPLTSKLRDGFTPILPVCSFARVPAYILRILRSMGKSNFYGHFKRIRVSLKKSSTP